MMCNFCYLTRTDVMRVRDGDHLAEKLRSFARVKYRYLPEYGEFYICPTCLGEFSHPSHELELQMRADMRAHGIPWH